MEPNKIPASLVVKPNSDFKSLMKKIGQLSKQMEILLDDQNFKEAWTLSEIALNLSIPHLAFPTKNFFKCLSLIWFNRGICLRQQGNSIEGIDAYEKAKCYDTNCLLSNLNIGRAYSDLKQPENACKYANLFLKTLKGRHYRKCYRVEAYRIMGVNQARQSLFKEAIHSFNKALNLNPACMLTKFNLYTALEKEKQESLLFLEYEKQAKLMFSEQNIEISLAILSKGAKELVSARLYALLGDFHLTLGNSLLAQENYSSSSNIHPHHPYPYIQKSQVLTQLGNIEGANKLLDVAFKLVPRTFYELLYLAKITYLRTDPQAHFEHIIKTLNDWQNHYPHEAKPLISMGNILAECKKYVEAEECYDKAIKFSIDNEDEALANFNKALIFEEQGRLLDALLIHDKILNDDVELLIEPTKARIKACTSMKGKRVALFSNNLNLL